MSETNQRNFTGPNFQTLDDKGRIVMPSRFRFDLGETYVLTCGPGRCLWAFHRQDWEAFSESIARLPINARGALELQRFFLGSAMETKQDLQGRSLIPQTLRAMAGIDTNKDIVVVGCGNRIEVWSRQAWDQYNTRFTDAYVTELLTGTSLGGDSRPPAAGGE